MTLQPRSAIGSDTTYVSPLPSTPIIYGDDSVTVSQSGLGFDTPSQIRGFGWSGENLGISATADVPYVAGTTGTAEGEAGSFGLGGVFVTIAYNDGSVTQLNVPVLPTGSSGVTTATSASGGMFTVNVLAVPETPENTTVRVFPQH